MHVWVIIIIIIIIFIIIIINFIGEVFVDAIYGEILGAVVPNAL